MTQVAKDTQLLKDYISTQVKRLEKGNYAYIKGGYSQHSYVDRLIDANC